MKSEIELSCGFISLVHILFNKEFSYKVSKNENSAEDLAEEEGGRWEEGGTWLLQGEGQWELSDIWKSIVMKITPFK